jgi:hypothetical protein
MAGMALDILLAFVMATHDPVASPRLIDAACAEAAAIWRPYGVQLRCTDSPATAPSALTVVVTNRERPAENEPLGSTGFDENGAPGRTLTVFLDAVIRLVSASLFRDVRCDLWPRNARDAFLARGLGRVIAHEIGHYLLGPGHTKGLMRRSFEGNELIDVSSVRFQLSAPDSRRLAEAMNMLHHCDEHNAIGASACGF